LSTAEHCIHLVPSLLDKQKGLIT